MNQRLKNIIVALAIVLFGVLVYYFSYIVSYILIAAVLALIGRPITRKLQQFRYRRFHIGESAAALLTLLALWFVMLGFFIFLIPLVVSEVDQLSTINIQDVVAYLNNAVIQIKTNFPQIAPNIPSGGNLETYLTSQLKGLLNVSQVSNLFGSVATVVGNFFMMVFSVSFVLYFFLKEEDLFRSWILVLAPEKIESRVSVVMDKVANLLKRYLIGILQQISAVMVFSVIGYSIVGLGFSHAGVVGFLGGWMTC